MAHAERQPWIRLTAGRKTAASRQRGTGAHGESPRSSRACTEARTRGTRVDANEPPLKGGTVCQFVIGRIPYLGPFAC